MKDYSVSEAHQLQGLDDAGQQRLAEELQNIAQHWWVLPDWSLIVIGLLGLFLLFYLDSLWAHGAAALLVVFGLGQLHYRYGVYNGFRNGYWEGHASGVRKALGLSDTDAAEIEDLMHEARVAQGPNRSPRR